MTTLNMTLDLSLLALQGSIDFNTGQALENARSNDKDHLFPKREFSSKNDLNSVLNITWMSEETNRKIKRYEKPSEYIPRFISEKYGNDEKQFLKVLQTHLINSNAYQYMQQNNFEGFTAEREKQGTLENQGVNWS